MNRRSAHRGLFLFLFLLCGTGSDAGDFDPWTVIRDIEYAPGDTLSGFYRRTTGR